MEQLDNINVLYSETLEETADSIEALSKSNIFVCGTYQLLDRKKEDGESTQRVGSIILYEIKDENEIVKLQTVHLKAVLDMKWHSNEYPVLSVADSCGNTLFYEYTDGKLHEKASLSLHEEALCLSTDWCKTDQPEKAVYSLSSGDLCLVDYANSKPVILNTWKAHSLEAWIVAADYENVNLFYSGADDCLLKLWDVRVGYHHACFTSKHYMMGVCSLQASKHHPHIFCAGSYDETVSLWDNRNMRQPLCSTEAGGGVWRLKWHPMYANVILAACMHDGYKVIKLQDDLSHMKVLYSYQKHESLAYGVDWCQFPQNCENIDQALDKVILGCCSFYDKFLSVIQF